MSDPRKRRAKEIEAAIREVLLKDWNPIGLEEADLPPDEYDRYIAPVYRVLVGSRSEEDLVRCLEECSDYIMGASPHKLMPGAPGWDLLLGIARKLLAIDVKL